jgi:hypothetical protein
MADLELVVVVQEMDNFLEAEAVEPERAEVARLVRMEE